MGLSRYETVFRLYCKVRDVEAKQDGLYKLKDMVEYDEDLPQRAVCKQALHNEKVDCEKVVRREWHSANKFMLRQLPSKRSNLNKLGAGKL